MQAQRTTEPQGTHRQTPRQHQKARRSMQEIHLHRDGGGVAWKIKRGFKACCLSCMDGKQTCKFFRLIQVAWTGSLSVWICRNIYRWEGPAQTSAFFSLSKEHSGCKGSKKGRDRERSKLQSEFCRKSRHRHSCNTPPTPKPTTHWETHRKDNMCICLHTGQGDGMWSFNTI